MYGRQKVTYVTSLRTFKAVSIINAIQMPNMTEDCRNRNKETLSSAFGTTSHLSPWHFYCQLTTAVQVLLRLVT